MRAQIISIMNHKGGVGKTTTAVNVADALAREGVKVLAVDLDPQANLTYCLEGNAKVERGTYEVITQGGALPIARRGSHLHVLPSSASLAGADAFLLKQKDIGRLRDVLEVARSRYDCIILDCPPGISILTQNAVVASQHIIVTMEPCTLSFNGFSSILKMIAEMARRGETVAKVDGVVLTRYKLGRKVHKAVEDTTRKDWGNIVFTTKIRECVKLAECALFSKTIFEYNSKCNGATDYKALTFEIMERYNIKHQAK